MGSNLTAAGGQAEAHGSIRAAPQLYFNGNPAPVPTGGDIYVSEQGADGSFGPAFPVAELNSPSTDQRPSVAHSGLEIYIHSDRPGSSSFDIWVSTRESVLAPWLPPTNLGLPVNTGVGELFPLIVSHGETESLYFTRDVGIPPAVNFDLFVTTRSRGGRR